MDKSELYQLIETQTAIVTIILVCVAIILLDICVDFLCSMLFRKWHSPCGFFNRRGNEKNETK